MPLTAGILGWRYGQITSPRGRLVSHLWRPNRRDPESNMKGFSLEALRLRLSTDLPCAKCACFCLARKTALNYKEQKKTQKIHFSQKKLKKMCSQGNRSGTFLPIPKR